MRQLALCLLLVFAAEGFSEDNAPKEGTYYKYGQLGVKKTEINGNRINLVFQPVKETFHWCPGIKIQKTKKATVVTFIRCKTSKSCSVDKKASIGKHMVRKVAIDSNGLDVFVRTGPKQFKRIYKSPNSKVKAGGSKTEKPSAQRPKTAELNPRRYYVLKRDVKNYVLQSTSD